MNSLKFLLQYITKPRTVGAVLPSSRYLARKMAMCVDFDKATHIVEYGPGTGVFTDEILRSLRPDAKLLLLERNEDFARALGAKYEGAKNVTVVNDSAERAQKHLRMHSFPHADYVLSGLPFASLPKETSENILRQTVEILAPGGKFVTFQYSLLRKDFITRHFGEVSIAREFRNVPPAYVLCCEKADISPGA